MKFKKSLLASVIISFTLVVPFHQAQAKGTFKKLVAVAGLTAAGIVAYKMAKKLNIGDVTKNLARHPDNAIPYLTENPDKIPEVCAGLEKLFNDPEMTPDNSPPPKDFIILADTVETHFGIPVNRGPWTGVPPDAKNPSPSVVIKQKPIENKIVLKNSDKEDEDLLESNMVEAGYGDKPEGFKAFHIVKKKDPNFTEANSIFQKLNININSALNGVYVEADKAKELIEDNGYAQYVSKVVSDAYKKAPSKVSVENALRNIHNDLSNHKYSWK